VHGGGRLDDSNPFANLSTSLRRTASYG